MTSKTNATALLIGFFMSVTATAQTKMTCSLRVSDLADESIPLVYDGLQKAYELPFSIAEGEDGRLTFTSYTVEDFMPAFHGKLDEQTERVNHLHAKNSLARFFGRINASQRVAKAFSVAEVRVMSRGGEITPDTEVRLTLRNGNSIGAFEEPIHTSPFRMSVCPKAQFPAGFMRANGSLGFIPVRIECSCP